MTQDTKTIDAIMDQINSLQYKPLFAGQFRPTAATVRAAVTDALAQAQAQAGADALNKARNHILRMASEWQGSSIEVQSNGLRERATAAYEIAAKLQALKGAAQPAPAAQRITKLEVMSALNLCPTDLSFPDRCQWIADRLQEPEP